jgi:hypothetical protein
VFTSCLTFPVCDVISILEDFSSRRTRNWSQVPLLWLIDDTFSFVFFFSSVLPSFLPMKSFGLLILANKTFFCLSGGYLRGTTNKETTNSIGLIMVWKCGEIPENDQLWWLTTMCTNVWARGSTTINHQQLTMTFSSLHCLAFKHLWYWNRFVFAVSSFILLSFAIVPLSHRGIFNDQPVNKVDTVCYKSSIVSNKENTTFTDLSMNHFD